MKIVEKFKKHIQKEKRRKFLEKNGKLISAGVIIVALIFIAVLAVVLTNNHGKYTEVTYSELRNKMDNKESFILFIGANSCSHCSDYKIMIQELDKKIVFDYIDLDKVTKEEYNWLKSKFNFTGTPSTYFIVDGKQDINGFFDGADYTKLMKMLKKYGYIKG